MRTFTAYAHESCHICGNATHPCHTVPCHGLFELLPSGRSYKSYYAQSHICFTYALVTKFTQLAVCHYCLHVHAVHSPLKKAIQLHRASFISRNCPHISRINASMHTMLLFDSIYISFLCFCLFVFLVCNSRVSTTSTVSPLATALSKYKDIHYIKTVRNCVLWMWKHHNRLFLTWAAPVNKWFYCSLIMRWYHMSLLP